MKTPLFFDAFTEIGPRQRKHAAEAWKTDHLLEAMDRCSIAGALVSSTLSVHYDPMHGNRLLSREAKRDGRLFPVWNILPPVAGEFPETKDWDQLFEDHEVAALSLHPLTNGWRWQGEYARETMQWLEEGTRPVLMRRREFRGFDELEDFLNRFPRLTLILTGASWTEQREIFPLLRRHPNLHITLERFQVHYGPESFHREGLHRRTLFGSESPAMSLGAARCFIDYAEIPADAKMDMAGRTMLRLLRKEAPAETPANPREDEFMRAARHGRPLPGGYIDLHMHILHEGLNGAGESHRMERGGPSGVFHLLRKTGCAGGGFMSWIGPVSCDSLAGNECVKEALDVAPAGFWGLATFDPVHMTPAELAEKIPALLSDGRFAGLKPYVRFGVEYHKPEYDVLWQAGNQHGLYALLHRVRGDCGEVESLAARFPNMRWLVAHAGKNFHAADQVIKAVRQYPNVYAEITHTNVPEGMVEYLAAGAGEDRVVYGSDLPMRDPRPQLGWVVYARLPAAAKQKILRANAMNIIRPLLGRLPRHNVPALPQDHPDS